MCARAANIRSNYWLNGWATSRINISSSRWSDSHHVRRPLESANWISDRQFYSYIYVFVNVRQHILFNGRCSSFVFMVALVIIWPTKILEDSFFMTLLPNSKLAFDTMMLADTSITINISFSCSYIIGKQCEYNTAIQTGQKYANYATLSCHRRRCHHIEKWTVAKSFLYHFVDLFVGHYHCCSS